MLSMRRQIRRQQTFAFSLKELEIRFNVLYASLQHTIASLALYAQVARHSKQRSRKIKALYLRFRNNWGDLADTVEAIRSYAMLLQYNEQMSGELTRLLLEQMRFMQAITSPEDITPEWVAKRNELAMMVCTLVGEEHVEEDRSPISSSQLV